MKRYEEIKKEIIKEAKKLGIPMNKLIIETDDAYTEDPNGTWSFNKELNKRRQTEKLFELIKEYWVIGNVESEDFIKSYKLLSVQNNHNKSKQTFTTTMKIIFIDGTTTTYINENVPKEYIVNLNR